MDWVSLIDNPKQVLAYYDSSPGLADFELVEIRYDRDGPTLYVRGNLSEYASKPSPRWHKSSNSVQINFQILGLAEFELNGVATGISGCLNFESRESEIEFQFSSSEGFTFRGLAAAVRCDSIGGYTDERRLTNGCS